MIKNIIFDWGGVLSKKEFRHSYCKNFHKLMPRHSLYEVTKVCKEEQQPYLVGKITSIHFFNNICHELGYDIPFKVMDKAFDKAIDINLSALKFVKKLDDYKLFLLSDNYKEVVKVLRKKYKLDSYFIKSYYSNEDGILKPNPKIFRKVLRENKLKARETVFVDDKRRNIIASNKLGIHGIQFHNLNKLKGRLKALGVVW